MPAYLVSLPENRRVQGSNTLVVHAADATDARTAATMQFDGDAAGLWATVASVTEIVAGLVLSDAGPGWSAYVRISGAAAQDDIVFPDPIVVQVDGLTKDQAQGVLGKVRLHISESDITINDGGASNVDDDVYTLVGGTFTRAATFIATGTGAITGFELSDPGEYSELPTLTNAAFTTSGSGTGEDIDLGQADVGSYEALMGQLVTDLTGAGLTAGVDMAEVGAGTRLFTVAAIADDIGDGTLEVEVRQNGDFFADLVSTLVDEGIAAAVLTWAIPASPLVPPRVDRMERRARAKPTQ